MGGVGRGGGAPRQRTANPTPAPAPTYWTSARRPARPSPERYPHPDQRKTSCTRTGLRHAGFGWRWAPAPTGWGTDATMHRQPTTQHQAAHHKPALHQQSTGCRPALPGYIAPLSCQILEKSDQQERKRGAQKRLPGACSALVQAQSRHKRGHPPPHTHTYTHTSSGRLNRVVGVHAVLPNGVNLAMMDASASHAGCCMTSLPDNTSARPKGPLTAPLMPPLPPRSKFTMIRISSAPPPVKTRPLRDRRTQANKPCPFPAIVECGGKLGSVYDRGSDCSLRQELTLGDNGKFVACTGSMQWSAFSSSSSRSGGTLKEQQTRARTVLKALLDPYLASCRQASAAPAAGPSTDGSAPLNNCEVGARLGGMHAHFFCRFMVIVCSAIGRLWPRPLWVLWLRRRDAALVGPPRGLGRSAALHCLTQVDGGA
jgi:hypothetical protein